MASGMADYSSVIRPKYGGAILSASSVWVWDGVLTNLVQINGKGMVYGGAVWLEPGFEESNSQVWLGIDGRLVEGLSFERLKKYGVANPRSAVMTINVFDSIKYIYSVGISYGLTFETRLDLWYNEEHGNRCTVHYRLIYTLI